MHERLRWALATLVVVGLVTATVAGPVAAADTAGGVTFVQSSITSDETWTPAGGPYRIVQDVRVGPGATLTVAPGTEVQLAEDITLTVAGSLVVDGTAENRVAIGGTPGAPADTEWDTIRYVGGRDSRLLLQNATVSGGTDAITVDSGAGRVGIYDATIRDVAASALTAGDAPTTPPITIERSTIAGVGGHAIQATPGDGAVDAVSVAVTPADRDHTATHTVSLSPGVEVTADELTLDYGSHGSLADVRRDSIRRIGIDDEGDARIDESLSDRVASVAAGEHGLRITFDGDVTVPGDGRLVVAYRNVRNPRTRGVYPVTVQLRRQGVAQLARGVDAPLAIGGVRTATRRREDTRVGPLRIADTTIRDVDGAGLFLDADRATDLHLYGDTVASAGGSAIAVRAKRADLSTWYADASARDAAISLAFRQRATLEGYGNRLHDSETGIRIRQSGAVAGTLRTTLRHDELVDNARYGIDARATDADLVGARIANATVARNGRGGAVFDTRSVREVTVVDDDVVDNAGVGLRLAGRTVTGRIAGNALARNAGDGIAVDPSLAARQLTVADNVVEDGGGHAVAVRSGLVVHRTEIRNNRLTNNAGAGVVVASPLTHAGVVNVTDNVVAANAYGVLVRGALGTRIAGNEIVFNTNAYADPVSVAGVRPGTGVAVAEGPAGAILRQGATRVPLADLVANPSVDRQLETSAFRPGTAVVLRTDGDSHARLREPAALAIRRVSEDIPTGIALPKANETPVGVTLADNDVYGQPRGLAVDVAPLVDANTTARIIVDRLRTVRAEANYWGAASGPYHRSILPAGEGDAVVTEQGWVDFVPFRTDPVGPRYARPVARLDAPANATVGSTVRVSGANASATPGSVARYHYGVNGSQRAVRSSPDISVEVGDRPVSISLAVEDDLGIDGASAATATIAPSPKPTTTTAPSTTTTAPPPTVSPPPRVGLVGGLLSLWGLLGGLFYLLALGLGAFGMALTLQNRTPPVGGWAVQGLAATGVLVWVLAGLLGPRVLLWVGVVGALAWGALTGGAYLLATRR